MTQSNGSALALASRLRALSDEQLLALLRMRDVRETGIRDFFDLADKLLDRTSIQNILSQLDRRTYERVDNALAAASGPDEEAG